MSGIAITFPSSPVEGQSYLAQNGFTYIYDSQKNRWKRGGEFVRAPKVLSYAGVAATTTGSGITTSPTGALIYNIPGVVLPNSEVGVDSYKAYRASDSYPNYTEVQVSISSAFSTIAYAATFTGTTHTIPGNTLSGDTTYYLRARQFVGSNAGAATTGAISSYSANPVRFITTSVYLDAPTIVSIAGASTFPVYQIGFANTTLPATVTYFGSGVGNLEKVEWRVTGPRNPDSTGDTALAEVGIGTFSSATLANALVLAMPFSGATGVGITNDVNNAIRTASGASAGTTKTFTIAGTASTVAVGIATTTSHFYPNAAYFNGSTDYITTPDSADFTMGSGNFTIECWVYNQNTGTRKFILGQGPSNGADAGTSFLIEKTTADKVIGYANTTTAISVTSNSSLPVNTWTHIAFVRNGSTLNLYLNGILEASSNTISTQSINDSTNQLSVGRLGEYATTSTYYQGYIQDLKIYKGLAKYTENFTPPLPTYGTISYTTRTIGSVGVATTAFFESTGDIPTAEVAIGSSTAAQVASSLVLAMPMNRTFGFQDINVAIRGLTSGASAGTAKTVGLGTTSTANAPSHPIISSTESKWYDGAAYFAVGDYATIFSNTDFDFGTEFTMEAWIYPVSGTAQILVFDWRPGNTTGIVLINADGALAYWNYPTNIPSTGKVQFNSWNHCAWVFSSSTVNFYINGVFAGSGSASVAQPDSNSITINGQSQGTFYIQDAKIYKGLAKYTANFTPPQPICGFTTDLAIQTGFTTTSATGALLSSVVGLGSTSTLAFGADQNLVGVTSITSSSGITTLPDPYAQNLVLALPLANITGVGNSFTNDRNTQIRSVSLVGGGTTNTITNVGISTVSVASSTSSQGYNNFAYNPNGSSYLRSSTSLITYSSSSSFTLECWVFRTSGKGVSLYADGNRISLLWLNFYVDSSTGKLGVYSYPSGSVGNSNLSVPENKWTHIAFVSNNGRITFYIDGVLDSVSGIAAAPGGSASLYNIIDSSGVYYQDYKIYNTPKYVSSFTPPPPMFGDYTRSTPNKIVFTPGSDYVLEARNTATGGIVTTSYSATRQWGTKPKGGIYDPFASNLVLAIPGGAVGGATSTFDVTGQIRFETPTATYVNAGIVTYSNSLGIGTYQNKTTTINGNVSISSTITKYYSRSIYFDGSGDWINIPSSSDFTYGTGDFTIEMWFYISNGATSGYSRASLICPPEAETTNQINISLSGSTQGAGGVVVQNSGTLINYTTPIPQATWHHIAVSRKNSTTRLFLNGIQIGSAADTKSYTQASYNLASLKASNDSYTDYFQGYMTDVRIYKGVAKYTSNFTPPNQIYLT